ncbi:P-loop containing nucleoside triphosphate hydrolase protein [Sparassis latifolia]
MPEYQLGVAILLTTTAVCSFGVFLISVREGKIQLPVNVREQESLLNDLFDVTTSEDALDGTPVDEDSFWRRMRLWKLAIVLLLAATALLCTTAILPSSQSIGAAAFRDVSVPPALWYNALVLYTSAFLIAVNIPCGPPLHCPSERIYSDKTLMLVNTREEANVCGVTGRPSSEGASVWDILCFSYCAKVVMLGSSAESIEIADLPIVPADICAANIYMGMRAAMHRWKLRIRDWRPKLGSGWELTYRLVRVNAHSLVLIVILASISAAMFYLPAFFLRRIISYLEKDPRRTDRGWGWVYCAGLFFSNVFVQLHPTFGDSQILCDSHRPTVLGVVGEPPSTATGAAQHDPLREDTRSQGSCINYRRRPTVKNGAEGEGAGGGDGDGEAKKKEDSEDDFSSNHILLTTLTYVSYLVGAQEKLMKARGERVSLLNESMAWERSFEARVLKNSTPFYYWTWAVTRWLSACFNLLSSAVVGITGLIAILAPSISVSLAGFTLAFASTVTNGLLFLSRWFVALEQSMVEVERIKEFSEIKREPPEFVEQRPPASWPEHGAIKCENLVIRYAPELPNVPHSLSLEIKPSEKVGVLGRTGSGKSTLALSFAASWSQQKGLGLTDLRSKLTIIPQSEDPTILSGTLRSMLDVFDEYEDAEINNMHYSRKSTSVRSSPMRPSNPSADTPAEDSGTLNANVNVFRNLESPVSEGGENFSTGEKQLLCMPRAILKCSRVLLMDEATASVDYATDELIGKTIRQEFADSTILTIAHRLRTVIDYDKIMLPEEGRIVEFDKPAVLLADPDSKFCSLCKATGKNEFAVLKAGVRS